MDDIVDRLARSPWLAGSPTGDLINDARLEIIRLREAVDEYKHRLHWANEELLKRGRP